MKHKADDLPRLPLFGPANSRGNRGRDRARGPEAGPRRDAALDPAIQACQGRARAVRVDCASSSQAVQLVDGRCEPRIPRVRTCKKKRSDVLCVLLSTCIHAADDDYREVDATLSRRSRTCSEHALAHVVVKETSAVAQPEAFSNSVCM
jgi:hypothetical protein